MREFDDVVGCACGGSSASSITFAYRGCPFFESPMWEWDPVTHVVNDGACTACGRLWERIEGQRFQE